MTDINSLIPDDHPVITNGPMPIQNAVAPNPADALIPDDHPAIANGPQPTSGYDINAPVVPRVDTGTPSIGQQTGQALYGTTRGSGILQGVRDIGNSVIQKTAAIAPDSVVQWLGHNYPHDIGPSETSDYHYTPQDILNMTHNEASEYDANKAASARKDSWDLPRAAGQIMSTGNPANGVAGLAYAGAMQPNYDATDATGVGTSTGLHSLESVGGGLFLKGLGHILSPTVNPAVKYLVDKGIYPTLGQIASTSETLGGKLTTATENALSRLPYIGDMIGDAKNAPVKEAIRQVYNDALAPLGQKSTADAGFPAVAEIKDAINTAYTDVKSKLNWTADPQWMQDMADAHNQIGLLPKPLRDEYSRITGAFNTATGKTNTMDGATFIRAQSDLKQAIADLTDRGQSSSSKALGRVLGGLNDKLDDSLARTNPAPLVDELNKVHLSNALYNRIVDATAAAKNKEGLFTPAQYMNAIGSWSGKSQIAMGSGINQEFANAASKVLGKGVPDSGTPRGNVMARSIAALLGGTAEVAHPLIATGAGLTAAAPYTNVGRKVIAKTIAGPRPEWLKPIGNAISAAAPYAAGQVPNTADQMQNLIQGTPQ